MSAGQALALAVLLVLTPGAAARGAEGLPLARPFALSRDYPPGVPFQGVRPLGALLLAPARIDGLPLVELSDLAWDADEGLLYAVSDQGNLFHLRPELRDGHLVGLAAVAAFPLRDRQGAPLAGRAADAEGMDARRSANGRRGDTVLVISFERRHRVVEYRPDGRPLRALALPAALLGPNRFASPNKGLEALTLACIAPRSTTAGAAWRCGQGRRVLLLAPEQPLAHSPPGQLPIVAADGRTWSYPLRREPNAALVAMQGLGDGTVLTLERAYGPWFLPVISSLRVIRPPPAGGTRLAPRTVAVLDSSRGWAVDNFEGLALHRGRRFFMVSDDNDRRVQRTVLAYFELLDPVRDHEGSSPDFEPGHESRP